MEKPSRRIRTLLVTNGPETGNPLAQRLGEVGFRVKQAHHAEGAARLTTSFTPHAILIQHPMPAEITKHVGAAIGGEMPKIVVVTEGMVAPDEVVSVIGRFRVGLSE